MVVLEENLCLSNLRLVQRFIFWQGNDTTSATKTVMERLEINLNVLVKSQTLRIVFHSMLPFDLTELETFSQEEQGSEVNLVKLANIIVAQVDF